MARKEHHGDHHPRLRRRHGLQRPPYVPPPRKEARRVCGPDKRRQQRGYRYGSVQGCGSRRLYLRHDQYRGSHRQRGHRTFRLQLRRAEPVSVYGKQSGENIIVPADSPYKTLSDLIEASKKNPNTKFGISTGGGVYDASVILEQSCRNEVRSHRRRRRCVTHDCPARQACGRHHSSLRSCKGIHPGGADQDSGTLLREPPALLKDIPTALKVRMPGTRPEYLYVCAENRPGSGQSPQCCDDGYLRQQRYKKEVNRYNLQEPWTLSVEDSIEELKPLSVNCS